MSLEERVTLHTIVICDGPGEGKMCLYEPGFVVQGGRWLVAGDLRAKGWSPVGTSIQCPKCQQEGT